MLRKGAVCLTGAAIALGSFATCGKAVAATAGRARGAAHVRPGTLLFGRHAGAARAQPGGSTPGQPSGRRKSQSLSVNWSGYAVSGGQYRRIAAQWTEPAAVCAGVKGRYASFWVGLDGLKTVTVEQIGTEVDCKGGAPAYKAWYEMYPHGPVFLTDPLRAGDRVSASVEYRGRARYVLVVRDLTRRWQHVVRAVLAGGAHSSAEAIVESPSSLGSVLPLADFGAVRFTGVTVNRSAIGRYHPVRIIMVSRSGSPEDAVSALSGGRTFTIAWRGRAGSGPGRVRR